VRVSVVGLGKIGLPLAVQIASRGHDVAGVDIDDGVVGAVNRGEAPFPGEAELDERLGAAVGSGRLRAMTKAADAVPDCDVVVVVVPLVIDADATPDYSVIDAATESVAVHLRPGALVSYETTLPVGTTRRRFTPALAEASGLEPGRELFVCHSPERVFSGRVFADLRRYPKLVGGIDPESGVRATAFYESFLEFDPRPDLDRPNGVWDLGSAEAAELAKLAETTYRDLNIAFANELALAAGELGVDVHRVIEASNSQPFSHIHAPGVAVGGHCIPVYPHLLMSSVAGFRLPAVARAVNTSMPGAAVDAVAAALGGLDGTRVVVLGLAYRPGVKEHAFSGAFGVADALGTAGARPLVHDPLYRADEIARLGFEPYELGTPCDAAIVQCAHEAYVQLGPDDLPGVRVVYDGRHHLRPDQWPGVTLVELGVGRSLGSAWSTLS
jgi:nucleotide sugar dehydrogenase